MIAVTRLNGSALALNPNLIERIERTPDTVLSCTTGTKYVVAESVEEIIERVLTFQASVLVTAERMRRQLNDETDFSLHVVRGDEED